MKKISLALSFLLFSNINLHAAHLTDTDIDTVLNDFECVEDALIRNPNTANYSLKKIQNEFGVYDDFDVLFGERYAELKAKITTALEKIELKKSPNYVAVQFQRIIISLSNPGIFPNLAQRDLKRVLLSVDNDKNCKEALEEALNAEKVALLKGIVPDNLIDTTYIQVKDVGVYNSGWYSTESFNTKYNPDFLNKKPLELNLDKLGKYTSSHISVTLINR